MLASKSLLPLHSLCFDTVLITSWIFGEGSHVIEEVDSCRGARDELVHHHPKSMFTNKRLVCFCLKAKITYIYAYIYIYKILKVPLGSEKRHLFCSMILLRIQS